ncbi:MAG: acyl-CoA mutase large subunit family protein [Bacteroidales bacterium]|jgi:methylmalonyl-CoA mutase|nr:acyl-CoA mutase large subunit family protein [Bacteroidales bacterium]MDI9553280.1 methylmalonyl-CoA mutase family protein [Bacteroidota bacterium]
MKHKKLFENFPPVSTDEWMAKINADLRGADFREKLVWLTREGFEVMPFYREEDLKHLSHVDGLLPLMLRKGEGEGNTSDSGRDAAQWLIRQDINVSDYREANLKALDILMKGVDSLGFIISDPESVSEDNISVLLDGIEPCGAEINFLPNGKAREIIAALKSIMQRKGINPSFLRGAVEADPLGLLMADGSLCIPLEDGLDYLASLTRETKALQSYRNIRIGGSRFTDSGCSTVQELAFCFSMAVEYLAQLTERGISPDDAASAMKFSFGIGTDYFMEIAKLRAARIIWDVIADSYAPADKSSFRMEIHSVTRKWNDQPEDPYINMLRTQTEAMSAIIGGTDSLTVNPFDITTGQPDEFSERMARNQQLILKEESWFGRVLDPAAGSYYIEELTSLIAEDSWKLFLEMEDKGGFLEALNSGFVKSKMENTIDGEKNRKS